MPAAPPLPEAPPPATRRLAVEQLAAGLSVFLGIPAVALRRTRLAETSHDLALLPALLPVQAPAILALAVQMVSEAGDPALSERLREPFEALRKAVAADLRGSRRPIIAAAIARGWPWRFVSTVGDLLQIGEGARAVRLSASGSRHTRAVATSIASEKSFANALLQRAGVPVARQALVKTADEVVGLAEQVGYPVVLKPVALRRQQGIQFVHRREQAEAALRRAGESGQAVVAESYLPGPEHRILVVDGQILAAFERAAPIVVGDGRSTIDQLVATANAAPDRGDWRLGAALSPIKLDAVAVDFLESQGWRPDSVPPAGLAVECHPLPFVGVGGGRRVDSTERIHPDNRAVAVRALAVLDLDAGGIDFRCPDISRSWREVGAGICEVNPRPDLSAHYLPGLERDVGALFLDRRSPHGGRGGRIPQVLLLGDPDPRYRAALAARAAGTALRWRVAAGWPGGGELDGDSCYPELANLPAMVAMVVETLAVDAAIYAAAPRDVLATGLGTDHLDLALVAPGSGRERAAALDALAAARVPVRPLPRQDAALAAAVLHAMRSFCEAATGAAARRGE